MSNPGLLMDRKADARGVGATCPRPLRSSTINPVPSPHSHHPSLPLLGPHHPWSTLCYGISETCSVCLPV